MQEFSDDINLFNIQNIYFYFRAKLCWSLRAADPLMDIRGVARSIFVSNKFNSTGKEFSYGTIHSNIPKTKQEEKIPIFRINTKYHLSYIIEIKIDLINWMFITSRLSLLLSAIIQLLLYPVMFRFPNFHSHFLATCCDWSISMHLFAC